MQKIRWQNVRFLRSAADPERFPDVDRPQIAVAGASNVGKSSLLNAIFGRRNLVKTSSRPGSTRLLNLFEVDNVLLLVDLPGYGFTRAPKRERVRWEKLITAYLRSSPGPVLVLVLMDIRHGPKPADLQLIEWLQAEGRPWRVIATKADKLSGNARTRRLAEMKGALPGNPEPLAVSSLDRRGIEDLRRLLESLL